MHMEFGRLALAFNLMGIYQELVPYDFAIGVKVEIHQLLLCHHFLADFSH